MKPHHAQESAAEEIADLLGAVDEVADLTITDDDLETQLQRLILGTPITWDINVMSFESVAGALVTVSAWRVRESGVRKAWVREVSLRLRMRLGVRVASVDELSQGRADLTGRAVQVDAATVDYLAGWRDVGPRSFFVRFEIPPGVGDYPVTIAMVCAVADGFESEHRPVLLRVTTDRPRRRRRAVPPGPTPVDPRMRMLSNLVGNRDPGVGSGPGSSPVVPGLAAFGGGLTIQNLSDGNRP
jgi:hypothetical protein